MSIQILSKKDYKIIKNFVESLKTIMKEENSLQTYKKRHKEFWHFGLLNDFILDIIDLMEIEHYFQYVFILDPHQTEIQKKNEKIRGYMLSHWNIDTLYCILEPLKPKIIIIKLNRYLIWNFYQTRIGGYQLSDLWIRRIKIISTYRKPVWWSFDYLYYMSRVKPKWEYLVITKDNEFMWSTNAINYGKDVLILFQIKKNYHEWIIHKPRIPGWYW